MMTVKNRFTRNPDIHINPKWSHLNIQFNTSGSIIFKDGEYEVTLKEIVEFMKASGIGGKK